MKQSFDQKLLSVLEKNTEAFWAVKEALDGVKTSVKILNDTNILHRTTLDRNTEAVVINSRSTDAVMSFVKWILIAVVLALIVLAGAEKVIPLLPAF